MTDVFISYARDDRERVRPIAEALQAEGWDVWWDPTQPSAGPSTGESLDRKLASAGAVLVLWSAASRGSEYVRSEAATGLYRNKLIQARIDSAAPPRPFDQVEVMDIGHWSGERDDAQWRRIVETVQLFAGAPGSLRPAVMRKAQQAGGSISYSEPKRPAIPLAPIIAAAAGVVALGGLAVLDPFHWLKPAAKTSTVAALTTRTTAEPAALSPVALKPAATSRASSPELQAAWERLNRTDPQAVRSFITAHGGTAEADAARSTLRVLDAQAWASAVTLDTAEAYSAYLAFFPADAAAPGAMAAGANDRLVALQAERAQAISDIQRALKSLSLFDGQVDGKAGADTMRGARQFATAYGKSAPNLEKAAPRDLRRFADAVEAETASGSTPQARAEAAARKQADAEADRKRRDDAVVAQALARRTADDMATAELQRQADARAAAAAAAAAATPKPDPFSVDLAPASVRAAVEAARQASSQASGRASAARQAAADADRLANDVGTNNVQAITAADGDRYIAQVQDGAPNGLGTRISGDATSAGDRYRGELRNGLGVGLGVYEFGNNPNNADAGALRYEGEHARDSASGLGVTYWKNGDRFAGNDAGSSSRGVMTFTDGRRYEGELVNGTRSGVGVLWNADGTVAMAGRWENGQLAEQAKAGD